MNMRNATYLRTQISVKGSDSSRVVSYLDLKLRRVKSGSFSGVSSGKKEVPNAVPFLMFRVLISAC